MSTEHVTLRWGAIAALALAVCALQPSRGLAQGLCGPADPSGPSAAQQACEAAAALARGQAPRPRRAYPEARDDRGRDGDFEARDDRDAPREGGPRVHLIERARIGEIREILGAARLVAAPDPACPPAYKVDGVCLTNAVAALLALGQTRATVVGLPYPPRAGETLRGRYGTDFTLYDLALGSPAPVAAVLPAQASDVSVPRDCYALPGEAVVYRLERRAGRDVAQERQTVVCGGGPRAPRGPYLPDGPTPPSAEPVVGEPPRRDPDVYPPTGAWMATGPARYLGLPDPACDPALLVRKTICARAGIQALQADPALKELDLIVAKAMPNLGDRLARDQVEQWVLKRRDAGFKIDKRWFEKSFLPSRAGCARVEPTRFRVFARGEAPFVEEVALNTCGAPTAPIPADIYEAEGETLPVAVRADSCPPGAALLDDLCFADAIAFMRGFGRTSTAVVLLRGEIYPRAVLYPDHGLEMATITRRDDGTYEAAAGLALPTEGYGMDRCQPFEGGDARRQGVHIEARGNRPVAVAYRWMSCPIY